PRDQVEAWLVESFGSADVAQNVHTLDPAVAEAFEVDEVPETWRSMKRSVEGTPKELMLLIDDAEPAVVRLHLRRRADCRPRPRAERAVGAMTACSPRADLELILPGNLRQGPAARSVRRQDERRTPSRPPCSAASTSRGGGTHEVEDDPDTAAADAAR